MRLPIANRDTFKTSRWTRRRLLHRMLASAPVALSPNLMRAIAPATPPPVSKPFSKFVDIAHSAGLTAEMPYGGTNAVKYIIESMGGGCAFFDYDNDGWMDIFILGGRKLEGVPAGASNRLYHNNRDGTFKDVTEKAGLLDAGWACGVCVGDYSNDGYEDLFVTYYGQNKLYHNNGDGTFTDVTAKAGLLYPHTRFGTGCTFFDYNRDGLLDLFVANYVEFDIENAPVPSLEKEGCNLEGVPVFCGPRVLTPPPHFLYRNNGDGTFTDVSKESGIAAARGSYGLTAVACDVDEDGWPDLVVACDMSPSLILMNNHDGTFREEGLVRGIAVSSDGQKMAGMGVGPGDYDLDGHIDFAKTHFQNQSTGLYRNNGKGEFDDVTDAAGIGVETRFVSWGVGLCDLDNDGNPDLFVVSGNVYTELEHTYAKYPRRNSRIVFRNDGNGKFTELGEETGPGIAARWVSRGCAFGDFDNDGDLDVVIMNMNDPPSLLRNDAPPANNWIKVRLEGTHSNRSAIGSRVVVSYGGKTHAQEVMSQASYLSCNDPRLHFGLGANATADVQVRWPDGKTETFPKLAANQLVTIREGQGIVKGRPFR
jgi:hypothetical protein